MKGAGGSPPPTSLMRLGHRVAPSASCGWGRRRKAAGVWSGLRLLKSHPPPPLPRSAASAAPPGQVAAHADNAKRAGQCETVSQRSVRREGPVHRMLSKLSCVGIGEGVSWCGGACGARGRERRAGDGAAYYGSLRRSSGCLWGGGCFPFAKRCWCGPVTIQDRKVEKFNPC